MSTIRIHRASLGGWLAVAAAVVAGGRAEAEPKYVGWTKVEASREIRELKEKLKEGGQPDDAARGFLADTVLPQLALDENRSLIETTRRRIREVVLADIGDDKAFGDLSQAMADFMTALARDDGAEQVVRVNAMLLVGELKAKDGRPWPGAEPALAAAAADKALPDAVRIAAVAGIARHVEKGVVGEAGETLRPAITAILEQGEAGVEGVEEEWLVGRALAMVPVLVKPLPAKLAATIAALVADDSRSVDVRVRAVAALGAATDATAQVDTAAVVAQIRGLAVGILEGEEKATAARRAEERYRRGGGPPAGMAAGFGPDGMPLPAVDPAAPTEQTCRRVAWQLYTLGTAILSADGKQGLALFMGDAAGPAKELAKQLRDEALRIDQTPDEDALLDALDELRPPAPGEKRPTRQPKAEQPADDGAKEGEPKPADPNASPFDSPFP